MVREADTLARTRGHHNATFCQADAEALPFRHDTCDLITSKLAFHYFPHLQVALEDHIVYVARGRGLLRMREKGQETREVKPGDILNLPRGVPHGFEKQGDENLVLLVVSTAGWKPLEDTQFYE
jgi:mannose-6-phosphate isomerase-like protein (cupin superfamily)